jgi:AraC family transcriptional regulator
MVETEFFGRRIRERRLGQYALSLRWYAPGLRVPLHEHSDAYVTAVIRGGYEEVAAGHRRRCGQQALVAHAGGERHANRFGQAATLCLDVHGVDVSASALIDSGPGAALTSKLYREFLHPDGLSAIVVEAVLMELHVEALRQPAVRTRAGWLEEIRGTIDRDFMHTQSLRELAAGVGLHPVHVARSFRQSFGRTVGEALRERRVAYARDRLLAGDRSITAIAAACGFADQSHLTRSFRRITGLTPAAFRALHANLIPGRKSRSRPRRGD